MKNKVGGKMKKKIINKKNIRDFLLINLGVFLMAFTYSVFIDRNNLVIGGVGGIATIFRSLLDGKKILGITISSSMIILFINCILLVFALIFVGKSFFLKTVYASVVYPVYVFIFESLFKIPTFENFIPNLSNIKTELIEALPNLSANSINVLTAGAYLLIIVFGGVLSGLGLGLALKKGASTGGVDIVQQILLVHFKIPFSVSLFLTDGLIVFVATFFFKDFFILLYGVIFIYISGHVLDAVAFSGFNSRAVYIITKEAEQVKEKIYEVLERGVTEVYSRGGYDQEDKKTLVCVMSNKEFYKMKSIILEIDERAFIYVVRASEVHGEGFTYDSPEAVGEKNE